MRNFFPRSRRPNPQLTLSSARCGESLRIVGFDPQSPVSGRLRELGFHETAEVRKIQDGNALLCQLGEVRLAIGRNLGAAVWVEGVRP